MTRLPSASTLQRAMVCRLSAQLPKAVEETEDAARGNAIHKYLELVAYRPGGAPEPDWKSHVPAEFHSDCEAVDVESLPPLGDGVHKEATLAFDYHTGAARLVGCGLGRDYTGLAPTEFPGTADVVGFSANGNTLVVLDYKTGTARTTPAARENWQLRMLGLAAHAALAPMAEHVVVGIVRTLDGTRVDAYSMDVIDLAETRARLIALGEALATDRQQDAVMGPHCRYCPSVSWCPAQSALIQKFIPLAVSNPESIYGMLNSANAAAVYERLRLVESAVNKAKQQLALFAERNPFSLPNGKRYGAVEATREEIDPAVAYRVVRSAFGQEAAERAITMDVTKAGLERVVKSVAPKGKASSMVRELLGEIATAGGIRVKNVKQIKEFSPVEELSLDANDA